MFPRVNLGLAFKEVRVKAWNSSEALEDLTSTGKHLLPLSFLRHAHLTKSPNEKHFGLMSGF
jgi:hypothetical protein